jgi:predicted DnaQ family exonuclease/DinG family helicase
MEFIILDIETTGLDIKYSSIIEVGAILVKNNKIEKEFHSFVQYDKDLPQEIKKLTGIQEGWLKDAPPLQIVLNQLNSFIGENPVVSHNGLGFDFPMLEHAGLNIEKKHDSLEFAFFVLPTNESGHSVLALAKRFELGNTPHRALEDCKLELEVIKKLQQEFLKRPKKKAETLKFFSYRYGWWWSEFLPGASRPVDQISSLVEKYQPYRKKDPLQDQLLLGTQQINFSDVEPYFIPSNNNQTNNEYKEDRPEQQKMAKMITNCFNEHKHLVVEAGTGTGKSKAYLVPSIIFALKNDIPVIIATHTKTLQDQLFLKEIPHLKSTIDPDLRVTMIKGKANYVCLQKFEKFIDSVDDMQQRSLYEFGQSGTKFTARLSAILLASWILETDRGDWDELPYWLKERFHKRVEQDVCNWDELCTKDICSFHEEEKCFLAKARLRAKDADIVVANHAVVLSGIIPSREREVITDQDNTEEVLAYSHTVFPNEAKFLIIDEAHHLEDDATSSWTYTISKSDFDKLIEQLYGKRGMVKTIGYALKENNDKRVFENINTLSSMETNMKIAAESFFTRLLPTLIQPSNYENGTSYRNFNDLLDKSEDKNDFTKSLEDLEERLLIIAGLLDYFCEEVEEERLRKIIKVRSRNIKAIISTINRFLDDDPEYIRYLERSKSVIEIKAAPLSVKKLLKEMLYDNFSSVVMTSATLTVNKTFNFFASRCGTTLLPREKIEYKILNSSFNYREQVQFFVTKNIEYDTSNYSKRNIHLEQCCNFLEKAIIASNGGALVLCSSYDQVDNLYNKLHNPLATRNISLLRQVKGYSVTSTIKDFREDINSVLIGTEALWQGIDVPGESLRTLFIIKIPYKMPGIPLIAARKEEIDIKGGSGFSQYYEPLAILTLKQGFGRLIRKATDKGIVIFMDSKILRKHAILNSFPDGVKPVGADEKIILDALEEQSAIIWPVLDYA